MRWLVLLALVFPHVVVAQDDDAVALFYSADSLLHRAEANWVDTGTPIAAYDTLLNTLLPTMTGALLGREARTGYAGGLRPLAFALHSDGSVRMGQTPIGPQPDLELGSELNRIGLVGMAMAQESGVRAVAVAFDNRGTVTEPDVGPALQVLLGDDSGRGATYLIPIEGTGYGTGIRLGPAVWAFGSAVFHDLPNAVDRVAHDTDWPKLPNDAVVGRPATQKDVAAGRAGFVLQTAGTGVVERVNVEIPQYAVLVEDGEPVPGILFQAESAHGIRSGAFRPVDPARSTTIVLVDTLVLLGRTPYGDHDHEHGHDHGHGHGHGHTH